MAVPQIILELVRRFDQHRAAYHSGEYNETQLRREFLDPFFETLVWDVFNKQGFSLHKQLAAARTPAEQTLLQRQIEAADRQIDALVYELYGLTDEEIKIVEGG